LDHTLVLVEFDACTAGAALTPPTCKVDLVEGRFVPTDGYLFADVYVNGTTILRNHGETADGREVVSKAEYSHYRPSVKTSRPGLSRNTVTAIAHAQATAVATVAVGGEAALRQTADEELQVQIDTLNAGNKGRDATINLLGGSVNTLEGVLDREVADRKDGETTVFKGLHALDARLTDTESRSVLVEGGASGMLIGRRSLQQVNQDGEPNGEMVRNGALGAGGFSLRLGLETGFGEVATFGNVAFGADGEGSGADSAYQIGMEALAGSSTLAGAFVAFQSTTDHANSVDASVLDNGVMVGLSVNHDFMPGSARITGYGRLGVGYSWYATKGTDETGVVIVPGSGFVSMLQLGVNFGAGASN
jgi:hypothetical protein